MTFIRSPLLITPHSLTRTLQKSTFSHAPTFNAIPSTSASNGTPFQIFDRQTKLKQKARILRIDREKSRETDYVREEVSIGLVDRLMDIKRKYREIVDLGSGPGVLMKDLEDYEGLEKVIMTDSSESMLWRDVDSDNPSIKVERILMDEESLNLVPDAHECIMSCLSLHWVNDLPGTLVQVKNALKPDGVFIGAMLGGDTLFELRTALQLADQERQGGISARVSPMTGMSKPAVGGENSGLINLYDMCTSRTFLRRDTLLAAASIYEALYKTTDKENRTCIPATFQVIYFIGWKPDPGQPKALERGSAERSLKELGTGSAL